MQCMPGAIHVSSITYATFSFRRIVFYIYRYIDILCCVLTTVVCVLLSNICVKIYIYIFFTIFHLFFTLCPAILHYYFVFRLLAIFFCNVLCFVTIRYSKMKKMRFFFFFIYIFLVTQRIDDGMGDRRTLVACLARVVNDTARIARAYGVEDSL